MSTTLMRIWYNKGMNRKNKVGKEQRDEIFAEVYVQTDSPIKAIQAAEPDLINKPAYASVKAHRTLQRPDMKERIDRKLTKMSTKALKTIDKLITSDNEQIATTNAWKVIEHNIGTPVKRSINVNAKANIEDALFQ